MTETSTHVGQHSIFNCATHECLLCRWFKRQMRLAKQDIPTPPGPIFVFHDSPQWCFVVSATLTSSHNSFQTIFSPLHCLSFRGVCHTTASDIFFFLYIIADRLTGLLAVWYAMCRIVSVLSGYAKKVKLLNPVNQIREKQRRIYYMDANGEIPFYPSLRERLVNLLITGKSICMAPLKVFQT